MATVRNGRKISEEVDGSSDEEVDDFVYRCPKFSAVWDPIGAMMWISNVEKTFETEKCTDEDKVKFAVFLLKSEARVWWDRVKDTTSGPRKLTWSQFKEAFRNEFFPVSMELELVEEYRKLKMGRNESVREYSWRFEKLWFYWSSLTTEKRNTYLYVGGLTDEIKDVLSIRDMTSLENVIEVSRVINEENVRRLQGRFVPRRRRERRMCSSCEKKHWGGECGYGSMGCFRCGESSHLAPACPSV